MSWTIEVTSLEVTSLAQADGAGAYKWYEERQPGCGEDFLVDLDQAFHRISEFGDTYERVAARCHRILLRRFPYCVYYELRDGGIALVRAVLHCSRDPELWKERL